MTVDLRRAATPLLALPILLTACSGDDRRAVTADDIDRIERTLVNGSELAWELTQAEARVAQACMEDLGFTVHHPTRLHGRSIPHRFEGFSSPYTRIPLREHAEQWGFGVWMLTDPEMAAEIRENPEYLEAAASEQTWRDPASFEARERFDKSDEEYRREWLEAFAGPEKIAYEQEMNAAHEAGEDIAELDLEEPPYGGCELTTIEIVYGGPEHHEADDGRTWWSKPSLESPLTWVGDGELYPELSAQYIDQERGSLDCVAERGHGEWAFDDFGGLPVDQYLWQLYPDSPAVQPPAENLPEPPPDAPEDPAGAKEYEFAMALDFAECARSAGLRDGSEEAWARMYVERLIDRETEVYAWEQEIEEYLGNAQEYIAER
ncbi:hypothetical protein [Glycomyces xiaoerkulensis]|uniref:hypothetical protein n=1 Tax=Glycomyces xiaoerkulensis TaxID=2038139 RepID=UPI000C267990|nr:hypothetical protein [Glycomyces xiaoerkulensis]